MVTPRYKLPEMISGSLQMSAYNDRLAFLDALIAPIEVTEVLNQQNLAGIQNGKAQAVSASPTQVATNWYKDKASQLHVQVDGMIKFVGSHSVEARYGSAIALGDKYVIVKDTSREVMYSSTSSTTTVSFPAFSNFLTGASINNYAVIKPNVNLSGIFYVINAGNVATQLCINDSLANGGLCSTISAGQIKKFLVESGVVRSL